MDDAITEAAIANVNGYVFCHWVYYRSDAFGYTKGQIWKQQ